MKKIMFNDRFGLTQAVLEGRKTMTRRIIKAPKTMEGQWVSGFAICKRPGSDEFVEVMALDADGRMINNILPKYKPGEIVAVAQRYEEALSPLDWVNRLIYKDEPGWTNKSFVRADLMPHQIRITNVRVERLQDISDEDCIREGVQREGYGYYIRGESDIIGLSAKSVFEILINKISRKEIFESNPWVFVYEFEITKA